MDKPDNKEQNQDNSSTKDIQFEEVINIDDIQKKLQLNDEEFSSEIQKIQNTSDNEKKVPEAIQKAPQDIKKYVIYIDPENIDYMENLSIQERKDVINNILKEKNTQDLTNREIFHKKKLVANVLLACITFVIFFPLLFFLVNSATEASIQNYEAARQNFLKLYKKDGKISVKGLKQLVSF